jgi:hypothetical protein
VKVYTFSQLQQFLACPRKYRYAYVERISPVYDGTPRPVGTAVHVGIEQLVGGATVADATRSAYEAYRGEIPRATYDGLTEKERRDVDGGWLVVEDMLAGYPWREGIQVVARELIAEKDMGHDRVYKGRVDQLVVINQSLWVLDSKTTGFELDKMLKVHRLRKQYTGYYILAEEWLAHSEAADPLPALAGVMIDMLKKPRVYWKRKNKELTGEASVTNRGYHREPMHVTQRMVEDFYGWFHHVAGLIEMNLSETYVLGETVADMPRGSAFPMNTDTCFSFNRICPYFEFCRNPDRYKGMLDTDKFKVREEEHPEFGDEQGKEGRLQEAPPGERAGRAADPPEQGQGQEERGGHVLGGLPGDHVDPSDRREG